MKLSKATTVDQFLVEAPAETHATVQRLREIVRAAVPQAEETMSYGKPFYKYHGYLVGITLYAKWLGVEIFDGLTDADREELEALGYICGSKTFRVAYDQQVPAEILTRLAQEQAMCNETKR